MNLARSLYLLFFLLSSTLFSQTWIQKSNLPLTLANSEGTSFAIGDDIYVVCGAFASAYSNFCWQYNSTSDQWVQKSSFPGCPRRWPNSFVINGKGYFFGGEDTIAGTNNDLWEYDPSTDSWLQKTSLPGTIRCGAVTFAINGKAYVVSGAQQFGIVLNDCWEYDPGNDSWTAKASMPCTGRVWGAGFSILGKGYVGLGSNYSSNLRDWWQYDPVGDTWAIRDSFLYPVEEAASFSIGNYGYVGPGPYNFTNPYFFFRYDPLSDQWNQLPNFPGTQYWICYSTASSTNGYVISGYDGTTCIETTWEFTPPVGIEEYNTHSISSFPNPASEEIIFSSSEFIGNLNIRVVNMIGQVEQAQVIHPVDNRFTLSRNALKPGYYFLEVADDQGKISRIKFAFL